MSRADKQKLDNLTHGVLNIFSNATRPDASSLPAGSQIWNSSDHQINVTDGANWYDAMGNLT